LLRDPVTFIENVLAEGWKRLSVNMLITKAGLTKRTGTGISEAVHLLLTLLMHKS